MAAVLLVETDEGEIVGVRFPTPGEAREWEDSVEPPLRVVGVVRIVSRREALR